MRSAAWVDARSGSTARAGMAAGIIKLEASGREAWWWPAMQQGGVELDSGAGWWQPPWGMAGIAGAAEAAWTGIAGQNRAPAVHSASAKPHRRQIRVFT